MWNILKMADRRAKRTKIWDSRRYGLYIGYFSYPIAGVWFGVIQCTLVNFRFYDFRNATPSVVFKISIQLHTKYHNQGIIWAVTFIGNLPKFTKVMAL